MLSRLSLFAKKTSRECRELHLKTRGKPQEISLITLQHDAKCDESHKAYQERSHHELMHTLPPNALCIFSDRTVSNGPFGPYYPGHMFSFMTDMGAKPIEASVVSFRHNSGAMACNTDALTGKQELISVPFQSVCDEPNTVRESYLSQGQFVDFNEEISRLPYAPGIHPTYDNAYSIYCVPFPMMQPKKIPEVLLDLAVHVKTAFAGAIYGPEHLVYDNLGLTRPCLTPAHAVQQAIGTSHQEQHTIPHDSAAPYHQDRITSTRAPYPLHRFTKAGTMLDHALFYELPAFLRDALSNSILYPKNPESFFWSSVALFRLQSPAKAMQSLNIALDGSDQLERPIIEMAEELHTQATKQFSH